MGSHRIAVVLAIVGSVLAFTTIWLAFDNPDIDDTGRGDNYTCLAPWDTVLNGADNLPGGEPPADWKDIGARCREAGQQRFLLAAASGATAILAAVAAASVLRRGVRQDA